MKPKVVITHWIHPEVIALLEQTCEVIPNLTRETLPRQEIIQRTQDATGLMVFMPDSLDESFLQACPNLKIVAAALKGYDNFDIDACTGHGVWFTIVPDLLIAPTAELTIGLLLSVTRHILEGDRVIRSGQFAGWRPRLYGTGLQGKTLGIVGMGALGQALASRLVGFEMQLLYTDLIPLPAEKAEAWRIAPVSLESLLAVSDFVVLTVPLVPETFHLIDAKAIAQMKLASFLVNPCRGSVVDEQAVSDALASGHLAGYAADVFEMEDWARLDHPESIPGCLLKNTAQTTLTPHLGSAVTEVRQAIELEAAQNILQALRGETPQGAINQPL